MKRLKLAIIATTLVASSNANSAIISTDWQTVGDNLITQDTTSGLEWLDLSVTTSLSYNGVAARLTSGQELDSWRFATRDELVNFFDAFGGNSTYYTGYSTQNNGLFDQVSSFWGDTYCAYNSCETGQGMSNFYYSPQEKSPGVIYGGWIADDIRYSFYLTGDTVDLRGLSYYPTKVSPDFGSALVRVSAVPVPAAAWLFGSGLLGLAGFAKKNNAKR